LNSPFGIGTWASRSASVGGGAISVACDRILKKAKEIAAWMLGTSPSNLKYESPAFVIAAEPTKRIHFQKIVDEAYLGMHLPIGMEPGLEATCYFNPSESTFASGTHCAEVEVDIQTGKIKLLRYVAVNDFGNVINPMIVEGQVHGGVMQGIGQALLEQVHFDEDGRLVNSNFLDYLIPTATDPMPGSVENFETLYYQTKTIANPLGVKGMGESGAIVAPAAIVNAVSNALKEFHVDNLEMPLSPQKVLAAIRGKQS
jgi:carbon-monoxide dehydrogenase large subunit